MHITPRHQHPRSSHCLHNIYIDPLCYSILHITTCHPTSSGLCGLATRWRCHSKWLLLAVATQATLFHMVFLKTHPMFAVNPVVTTTSCFFLPTSGTSPTLVPLLQHLPIMFYTILMEKTRVVCPCSLTREVHMLIQCKIPSKVYCRRHLTKRGYWIHYL